MALKVVTLAEVKARSSLAEVQALDTTKLEQIEADALDMLEAELGRRLTLDTTDATRRVAGSGIALLPLPERLHSITAVVTQSGVDLTTLVETTHDGWSLRGKYPNKHKFTREVSITGKWGTTCPDQVKRVLLHVVEALAVRRDPGNSTDHRNELAPWGTINDGGLSTSRDTAERAETLENLLPYDVKIRLRVYYKPTIAAAV